MSDLIDRQKAIEALDFEIVHMTVFSNDEKNGTNPLAQYNKGLEDGIKALKALPAAGPERRWIPVTDRLPKDNRQVLVYAQSTHFVLAKYDEMMEPNGEWKKQWVTFDAWKPYYTVENVIAWMPLPEPWRGDR